MAKISFGKTWWSEQWIDGFKCIDYNNKMSKGLYLAELGLVRKINVEKNVITADIELGRFEPVKVSFIMSPFTEDQKIKIVDRIAKVPALLSDLQNRKLPTNLLFFCNKYKIKLIPNEWYDIKAEDSSPFATIPTEFMTALVYAISAEIDKNPFLIFEMHDFDVFAELEKQGHMIGAKKERTLLSSSNFWENKEGANENIETTVIPNYDLSLIPEMLDNMLTLLVEKPIFSPKKDFKKVLKSTLQDVSKNIYRLTRKEIEHPNEIFESIDEVSIVFDQYLELENVSFIDRQGEVLSFEKAKDLLEWLRIIPSSEVFKAIPEIRLLHQVYQFSLRLLYKSAATPQIFKVSSGYKIRWVPASFEPNVRSTIQYLRAFQERIFSSFSVEGELIATDINNQLNLLVSLMLNTIIREQSYDEDYMGNAILDFFFQGSVEPFDNFEQKEYPDIISLWLNRLYIAEKSIVPLIKVIDRDNEFILELQVEDKTKPDFPPIPLRQLFENEDYKALKFEALKEIMQLVDFFPDAKKLVDSEGKEKLTYSSNDFLNVIYKTLPALQMLGIRILLPKGMANITKPKISMKIKGENPNVENLSIVGLLGMVDFDWQIALGDTLVSMEEFERIMQEQKGILKINEEYIFIEEDDVKKLVADFHKMPKNLEGNDLLQIALAEDYNGAGIALDENARTLIKNIIDAPEVELPTALSANLRPYQTSGFQWMFKNAQLGLGSLIADDMGLGKTLQVITLLLKFKETGMIASDHPALVVVPTTLLTNWEKEIKKFAAPLTTFTFHGANKVLPKKLPDVVITTYGIARTQLDEINDHECKVLIIDEAQNIKNPNTAQTKAIKKLKAGIKIAMSGTPVENKLSEYWSIFDYTNKGYLGNLNDFKNQYARPIEIERNQKTLEKFRKVTSPFILRRLKSDKSIIKDLPDKIEMDQYCQLTTEQAAIYQNIVDSIMLEIESTDGISRKGQVLKLITALKQVCNHPANYLKKGSTDTLLSGKGAVAMALIDQILDNNEKTLIFTQYREMGEILSEQLMKERKIYAPFLHGGLSRSKRDSMVEDFQNQDNVKVMILSLKAGGTGLNLTAANNVIHYDMWWNPAIEAQATDRAYRIGQNKNVVVHRLLTQDTFEERINFMLQEKKELANLTVTSGESWIGDFSNDELKELVRLK